MTVYGLFNGQPIYNEIDAHACAWLRRLIAEGCISRGRVVEADIRTLSPADIGRGRRFHAFAGIGLWDHALRLADWPDELPVWTGSCPCQPFSVAGRGQGTADERHLWPAWFRLIRECRPQVVLSEQVASPVGLAWFDAVSADLEGEGYAVGAADLCAASVGAPHIRQRLFLVAYRQVLGRRERRALRRWGLLGTPAQGGRERLADDGGDGVAGNAGGAGLPRRASERGNDAAERAAAERASDDASRVVGESDGRGRAPRSVRDAGTGEEESPGGAVTDASSDSPLRGFWADAEWLICRDGKSRPVEPGTFPLAHGHSGRVAVVRPREQVGAEDQETYWYNRVGALKCIGNAIVPQVAAVFIEAALRSIYGAVDREGEP